MTVAISGDFLLAFSRVQKNHQKKVREFIELFRERPDSPGIHYEPIQSARDKSLYSVRIDQAYRAVVFRPAHESVYVLTWVDNHDAAYQWAARRVFAVNPLSGSLQVLDTEVAQAAAPEASPASPTGLFAEVRDKHLVRLGVPEAMLPVVRGIEDEHDLDLAAPSLPQEAQEALLFLAAGYTLSEVFREMEKPEEPVAAPPQTVQEALENEDSKRRFYVVDEAKDLAEILNAPLEQWRVFLHPKQRKLVAQTVGGPMRVLGGAGTGKTVVAMHRAKHLAGQPFSGKNERVLFTTFTKNLATDIQEGLRAICTPEELSRIEVINLDAWAANFLRSRGFRHRMIFDDEGNQYWQNALNVKPSDVDLSPAFFRNEWEMVVQAQSLTTADDYMRAHRVGRGTRLSRETKKKIWPVFEEYRAQLNEAGAKEYVDVLRDARQVIETKSLTLPYRSVVVDEAQDMSAEAFRLIRRIVPVAANDLFIVGDAHQRIYKHKVSLGQCGIDIRGRGRKLKVNYRTTEEIRRFAVTLLEGRDFDDLDGGSDEQKGYMSLTHGERPAVRIFPSFAEEAGDVCAHVKGLLDRNTPSESICVAARTHRIMEAYEDALKTAGLHTYEIKRDSADQAGRPGVRVATLHRIKGLEFEHVIVVSANDGVIPMRQAVADVDDPVAVRAAETAERALLYVGLTRAKRSAIITANGTPSPFLRTEASADARTR